LLNLSILIIHNMTHGFTKYVAHFARHFFGKGLFIRRKSNELNDFVWTKNSCRPRPRSAIKPPPVLPLVSKAEGRKRKAEVGGRRSEVVSQGPRAQTSPGFLGHRSWPRSPFLAGADHAFAQVARVQEVLFHPPQLLVEQVTPINLEISHVLRSADFPVCGIAGFQTRMALDRFDTLPTWKSATQQVGKPALLGGRPARTGNSRTGSL